MTFTGAFDFLSNFYPARVEVGGVCYSNAEAAFQAQKCVDAAERGEFAELVAVKAKRRGRQVKLRPDWDSVRLGVMEEVVRAKFRQNSDLAARLLGTGRLPLAEGNSWGDLFWGVDVKTGKGENHLGRILMKIREELLLSAETDVILRHWTDADADALFGLASDPQVGTAAGFHPHEDVGESLRVIREIFSNPESYAIVSAQDGKLLGCINLFPGHKGESVYESKVVKMGYWLGRPFWGHGLMVKAIGQLISRCRDSGEFRCSKVVGYAKEANARSRRVLEKAGFVHVETSGGACKYEIALQRR